MKHLLIATTLCLFCLSGQADEQKRLEKMASRLDLNDEQVSQVQEIFASHQQTREALREQKNALRLEIREELGTVLSEEQLEKLDSLHKKRHGNKSIDRG